LEQVERGPWRRGYKAGKKGEWEQFNWPDRFPEAGIEVSYQFKVRRTGLLYEMAPSK